MRLADPIARETREAARSTPQNVCLAIIGMQRENDAMRFSRTCNALHRCTTDAPFDDRTRSVSPTYVRHKIAAYISKLALDIDLRYTYTEPNKTTSALHARQW
jgi:hypothetical protein